MKSLSSILMLIALPFMAIGQYIIPDEVLVTYQASKKPLKEVLLDLSNESEVTIAFQDEIIPVDSLVSISVRRKPLGLALDEVLENSGVKYKITGNQIVLINDIYKQAKEQVTISGYMKDKETGETLVQANVFLYDKSIGTSSNEYGFYSFTVPKGLQRIYFSYAGYQQHIEELQLANDITLDIELDPYILLNEVVIVDSRISKEEEVLESVDVLAIDKMQSMLPLGGEADLIRLAQLSSGVSSGADGFGGISVRGGSVDQNLILLDGVPLYNPNHALGLYSVFNSSIIKSSKLIKGSFPAKYGSMLSSVLDIRTREGSNKGYRGELSLGLLVMKGSIEGPISKNGSSFLISFRRTFADAWVNGVRQALNGSSNRNQTGNTGYYFYDFNAKMNFRLGLRNRIYLSYYTGQDVFSNDTFISRNIDGVEATDFEDIQWSWGNTLLSMRLNSQLSKKAFLNTTIYSTNYNYQTYDHQRFENLGPNGFTFFNAGLFNSGIADLGARLDFDFIPNSKNILRLGVALISHRFDPGLITTNQNEGLIPVTKRLSKGELELLLEADQINGSEIQFFIEDIISLSPSAKLRLGYHQSLVSTSGKSYFLPQPRIAFMSNKNDFIFKTGLSFVSQYMHLLTNSGLGLPVDIWLPSTQNVAPQKGWVANIGIEKKTEKGFEYGVEAFYKNMTDIVSFTEGRFLDINDSSKWDENVPRGKGRAYGVEFNFNKTTGKYTWFTNYTISNSTRIFPNGEVNNGLRYPHRFDRLHYFKQAVIYKLNDNTEFAVNWVFGSGSPITLPDKPQLTTDDEGNPVIFVAYSSKNNWRLPSYHRMDIGFNFYNKLKYGSQKFTIGAYNVYNRSNPFYYDLRRSGSSLSNLDIQSVTILPFLPTIGFSISFH